MPIKPIVLQRRHAELGRIRLGNKQATSNGKTRPAKLETFRFTSHSERYIRDLATLYGGQARNWDNAGQAAWEVYTDAKSVPVIAVKGGLTQWMETWSGGGCVHRCDGETDATGNPCDLDEPDHINAKPTTRLSVMLVELEAIGVWRLESHGWNAAAEIPAVAELAQYVGDLVPAHLNLVERRVIKDGKTSRFVVPVLDLQIGAARLRQIVAQQSGAAIAAPVERPQLVAAPPPAIEAAPATEPVDVAGLAARCVTVEDARSLWTLLSGQGRLDEAAKAIITARVNELQAAQESEPAPAEVVGEIVDEPAPVPVAARQVTEADADAIWQEILRVAGEQGMTSTQLTEHFVARNGGITPDTASAGELAAYLEQLRGGAAA
ncbi:hypothetical protein [Actinopolymorpha alba]|uniref:recombination directionality factor n=1 Tax=Actinopolymorpha alba TaxID=533267 RepID=UPI0003781401|nr:hypothetical protein [Actinopolymorpha alba]